jgi:S1-C subfamily serine protease
VETRTGPKVGCLAVISLLAGLLGGLVGGYFAGRAAAPSDTGGLSLPIRPRPTSRGTAVLSEDDAVVQAVKRADPAVVKVISREQAYRNMIDYWFGLPPEVIEGVGSGFVFQYEDGKPYILTNTHVISGAEQIAIKLLDGRTIRGELAGADQQKDVAVVKLLASPSNLPGATLGDSSKLQIGDRVIAIGHPYDFEHTVTVGYVSAIGPRQIGEEGPWRTVIQTDAAINQGNSGGPLVNLAGAVIGVNSMIYSPSGGNIGLGFAIPINEAQEMLHFLVNGGPWIGVGAVEPNSPGFAGFYKLGTTKGVVVMHVHTDSPAAKAGLRRWDIILEADGNKLTNREELRSAIFAHEIGEEMAFRVQRGDRAYDLQVATGRTSGVTFGG